MRHICASILADEADHPHFHVENLSTLQSTRPSLPLLELIFWRCFQLATLLVVWHEHGQMLQA